MMPFLLDSFYRKLALTILACFTLIVVALALIIPDGVRRYQDEVAQKMHQDLAQHVVHDYPLVSKGQVDNEKVKQLFHDLMVLGPGYEFYLLDTQGNVLAYSADPGKVKLNHVNMLPIKNFLKHQVDFPLYGDDPRSQSQHKVFSASEIHKDGVLQGYMYVIVAGEVFDGITTAVNDSYVLRYAVLAILSVLGLSLLLALVVFALITKPLRKLTLDMDQYREQGFTQDTKNLYSWTQEGRENDIHRLGYTFRLMAERLTGQYMQLKSVDEMRRELLSHISHDLRTPLSSLQGYLETWLIEQSTSVDSPQTEYINIAHKNAVKVNHLVDQLFEIAHLDSTEIKITKEPVAIAELADDVLQKFSIQAKQKGVVLNISPKDPGIYVLADIEKLERVFSNLIENAIRHCRKGDRVIIRFTCDEGRVKVEVEDTGVGIPSSDLPFIFDSHYRAANSVRGDNSRGGLGLAITKKLLDLHKIDIKVESQLNQGTRFDFQIAQAV